MKKSLREILLQRHQSAENKLDAVRENALSQMSHAKAQRTPRPETFSLSGFAALRELLLSLRWHLAGMSAAWLLIAFFSLEQVPSPTTAVAKKNISSSQMILAALRENRRQLLEMIGPFESREAEPPKSFLPRPRSEWRYETATA